jgi:hypothetical protein
MLTFYYVTKKRFSPLDVHSAAEEIGGHENTLLEILELLISREKTQCYTHGCTKLEFQISKIHLLTYFIYESSKPIRIRINLGYLKTCSSVQRDKFLFLLIFLENSFMKKIVFHKRLNKYQEEEHNKELSGRKVCDFNIPKSFWQLAISVSNNIRIFAERWSRSGSKSESGSGSRFRVTKTFFTEKNTAIRKKGDELWAFHGIYSG